MTRSSAPPSAEDSSATCRARMSWYRGGVIFSRDGRFTHSWKPWNRPPLTTSSSGGASMCRMPPPAVIHWVSPSVISPPPPLESWCWNVPSMM